MSYTILIAGKGGTGKTTIASLLIRILKEKKTGSILAVDADPNSNLGENLGLKVKGSIGAMLDEIAKEPSKIPSGMTKDRFIEYQVHTTIAEADGFDLMVMGRPEGPGCYCYVNNVLRDTVAKLSKDYDYVVIDNEAGLEHLSRRTSRQAEALVVVSDATIIGIRAAKRIAELAKELNIEVKKRFLIINRFDKKIEKEKLAGLEMDYLGSIPEDKEIEQQSLNGNSLMDLSAQAISLKALREIGKKIWQRN